VAVAIARAEEAAAGAHHSVLGAARRRGCGPPKKAIRVRSSSMSKNALEQLRELKHLPVALGHHPLLID
jgi:hypothetical protein